MEAEIKWREYVNACGIMAALKMTDRIGRTKYISQETMPIHIWNRISQEVNFEIGIMFGQIEAELDKED